MGKNIDFISPLHNKTGRDYLRRVRDENKAECAAVAKKYGFDYWDGDRRFGYGGYRYDGRWAPVAEKIIDHYGLSAGDRVLDVGCGKGHLLFEMKKRMPDLEIAGIDISTYAIMHAKPEIQPCLSVADACMLPFADDAFDLVISLTVMHNLYLFDLEKALREMARVGNGPAYLVVESYRDEREKANLLYWQLTCECFYTPAEWEWLFTEFGYVGDYGFIFFE